MANLLLTSDLHLGHANCIIYDTRPFKTVEEMNKELIRRFNERVKEDDTCIIVGDFCISGKEHIDTPNGPKRIKSLKVGDLVYSSNIINRTIEISKVVNCLKSRSDTRLKITFENNYSILCTDNHPFAKSENGAIHWTQAKSLKSGDILFHRNDLYKQINLNNNDKWYKLGYIIGYIYGDGHSHFYGNEITSKDLDGLNRICLYIKEFYNITLKIQKSKKIYYRIRIPREIWLSLKHYDFTYLKISNQLSGWNKGFIAGFYDAEGNLTYQNGGWYIRINNTNLKLLHIIRKKLNYFNFKTILTPLYQYKSYKPSQTIKILTEDTCRFCILFKPAFKIKYPKLDILANGVKIKNIELINRKYSRFKNYNLTVEPNNNYFVKGVLVHNCFKNSPGGKPGEGLTEHAKNYIKQLNGNKVFVRGNHDRSNSVQTKIERLVLKVGGIYINVCHRPDDAIIQDDKYYSLNLVGHVHNAWKTKEISKNNKFSLMINVGVTTNNYYPYTFDEIKAIYDKWVHNHKNRKEINKCLLTQFPKNK